MVDKCNNTHLSCNEPRTQVGSKGRGGRAGITEATLRNRISKIYKIPQANRPK
jgi:hypothetical protein